MPLGRDDDTRTEPLGADQVVGVDVAWIQRRHRSAAFLLGP